MPKYELSNDQVKSLQTILANVDIKGRDAPVIIELSRALQRPVVEKEEEK